MNKRLIACLFGVLGISASASAPAVEPLELDFTFPLGQVIGNLGNVSAIAVNPTGEAAAIIDDRSQLIVLSLEGDLLLRRALDFAGNITGAEWPVDNSLVLATRHGRILKYDLDTHTLSKYLNLPGKLNLQAVAASADGRVYAIDNRGRGKLLSKRPGERLSKRTLDRRLKRFRITGLYAVNDSLYATALPRRHRHRDPLIVKLSRRGQILDAWTIGGKPSGLSILEETENGPVLLTSNIDVDASLLFYEPEQGPGDVDIPSLPLLNSFSLSDASISQPSGIAYSAQDRKLYVVTDFGVVARTNLDGSQTEILFQIPDTAQGTFEAIAVDSAGNIVLLSSDESLDTSSLLIFDVTGNLITQSDLPMADLTTQAFAIDPLSLDRWWVAQVDGQPTSLELQRTDGERMSVELPDSYSNLSFTGLEVVGNRAYLVTEEREQNDQILAGLIIIWDLAQRVESGRYTVATNDEDGTLIGVRSPSGISIDPESNTLHVTSDTNDGNVYGYSLSNRASKQNK